MAPIIKKNTWSEETLPEHRVYLKFSRNLCKDATQLKEQIQKMCPLISEVKRPRQPRVNFCFVYFKTAKDLEKGLKMLSDIEIFGKKLIVRQPLSEEMIKQKHQESLERRAAKLLTKKLKYKAKIQAKVGKNNVNTSGLKNK